jgi:16S rRNA (guanine966-N2)-methyltransferase
MCQLAKRNAENKTQPGRLRIVAGKWRSRLLEIADVPGLRPTSARIRETLFNWLAPRIAGARCLDLFAGTGALGLEALSRGATDCVFVEKSTKAAKTLQANIVTLQADSAVVYETSAAKFLQKGGAKRYEIAFLDPPFAAEMLPEICKLLEQSSVLADNACIYIEEDRNHPELRLPERWQVLKTKNSGNVRYSLLDAGSQT